MPLIKLIADAGASKAEWCLLSGKKKTLLETGGISPYLMNTAAIAELLTFGLSAKLGKTRVDEIFYYGTGCSDSENVKSIKTAIKQVFPAARIKVDHDMMAAARALCGDEKGMASILGTGSNSCFFNGRKIVKNHPALGFILGDEGSGAYLGKLCIRHYLYGIFDQDMKEKFEDRFKVSKAIILDNVYRKPLANRYLAGFTAFLIENRGNYIVENIVEDGLNDFFIHHLSSYEESRKYPLHFAGGVAWQFRDVLKALCENHDMALGRVMRRPMEGLIRYHQS
ncbi:MAG TPA: N-acetylglucosamine kinase [Parasegetibacter sp.]|jgi:glucosamine kinase